jgi:hypothetical protein
VADQRDVRRRRGTKPGPEARAVAFTRVGEELERAPHERSAAHFVQRRVPAVQLGRAGHAQAAAEPRHHDLPREVGERHRRRATVLADVERHRVAFRRVDAARHADRREQLRAEAAERDDHGVGDERPGAAVRVAAAHAAHRVARDLDRLDARAPAKRRAARRRELRELDGERVRVARLVRRREDAAGQPVAARGERGLDRDALGGGPHDAVAAELAHQRRRRDAVLELLGVRVELQDAALEVVVGDAGLAPQLAQAVARVEREVEALDRVVPRAGRQALDQEAQAPQPLPRVGAQPEEQRRVLAPEPFRDLERRLRIRPRLGVGRGDLPAVHERGLERRPLLPVDERDLVAVGGEIPRGGDADHASAEHEDAHRQVGAAAGAGSPATSATGMQLQNRLRSP